MRTANLAWLGVLLMVASAAVSPQSWAQSGQNLVIAQTQAGTAPSTPTTMLATTSEISGFHIVAYKGLVQGVAVRQPTWAQNSSAGMQGFGGGGDVPAYTQMCEQGRLEACLSIIRNATNMGANAVVGVRFDNSSLPINKNTFATEIACYGTAVVIEPNNR